MDAIVPFCITDAECKALSVIAADYRMRARDRYEEAAAAHRRVAERRTLAGQQATLGWAEVNENQGRKYDAYADFCLGLIEKYGPSDNLFRPPRYPETDTITVTGAGATATIT